jgi:hypothetical protein
MNASENVFKEISFIEELHDPYQLPKFIIQVGTIQKRVA